MQNQSTVFPRFFWVASRMARWVSVVWVSVVAVLLFLAASRPVTKDARAQTESPADITFAPDTVAVRALFVAVERDDPATVNQAFASGADANATVPTDYHYKKAKPVAAEPLFLSVPFGTNNKIAQDDKEGMAFLRELLRRHVNVNTVCPSEYDGPDESGTALAVAHERELPDVEKLLKKAGSRK